MESMTLPVEMVTFVEGKIYPGYYQAEQIVKEAQIWFEEEGFVTAEVAGLVRRLWTARARAVAAHADVDDSPRVRAAFQALQGEGLLVRENFSCCQNCAVAEIHDEATPTDPDDPDSFPKEWGYAFFHQQDAEQLAVDPTDLYLAYGPLGPLPRWSAEQVERLLSEDCPEQERADAWDEAQLVVGDTVVDAFRAQRLSVEWNRNPLERIKIRGLRWYPPLPN